jgi:hypothetical protein
MRKLMAGLTAAGLLIGMAVPALAAEPTTARDIQAAVDSYVASAGRDASLVGGPGSAGYDAGFWIRGGDFSLRINATLQARYEAILWDEVDPGSPAFPGNVDPFGGGGDRSGFSLPRAVLKFSGTAPCCTRYYIELDFGHFGEEINDPLRAQPFPLAPNEILGPGGRERQSENFANTREAWIEWGASPEFNIRMGQIELPVTRQLLTDPALQQFVDISLASSVTGTLLPGYTDRNRDHGIMVHGAFGCNGEFSYMLAITNGDSGDSIRNILDGRTDDNLSYSGRLNWAFLKPTGYEESALRQNTCEWYGEAGVWAYYHSDRRDYAVAAPPAEEFDYLYLGLDLQLGYGGFSFTGAFTWFDFGASSVGALDADGWAALVQAGFLFPDTAWEIAARWSMVQQDDAVGDGMLSEYAAAVNYYLNGHGNKLTLDASWITADDNLPAVLAGHIDRYPGYAGGYNVGGAANDVLLLRFQWQVAL